MFALNLITGLGSARYRLRAARRQPLSRAAGRRRRHQGRRGAPVLDHRRPHGDLLGVTVARALSALLTSSRSTSCAPSPTPVSRSRCSRRARLVIALPAVLAALGAPVNRSRSSAATSPQDTGVWGEPGPRGPDALARPGHPGHRRPAPRARPPPTCRRTSARARRALPEDAPPPSPHRCCASSSPATRAPARRRASRPGGARPWPAAPGRLSRVAGVVRSRPPPRLVADGNVVAPNPQPQASALPAGRAALGRGGRRPAIARSAGLVTAIRALPAPASGVLVGGAAAEYTDTQAGITSRLPACT